MLATFGVIIEVTTTANPKLNLQAVYIKTVSLNPFAMQNFLKICIANAQQWANDGWGGYIEPGAITSQGSGLVLFTPKLTNAQAKVSMKPITDWASALGTLALNNVVAEAGSFLNAYNTYLVPNEELVGLGTAIGSRLIPAANFNGAANQTQLFNALMNVSNIVQSQLPIAYGAPLQFLVTTPTNYPDDGTSSITPAWRNSLWHVFINSAFSNEASASTIAAAFQRSHSAAQFLRNITPGSG